jgi:hypothetical protein
MYNLLVLGLVPGTNLQITFKTWLDVLGLVVAAYGATSLYRGRFTIGAVNVRQPLHASQLHSRF